MVNKIERDVFLRNEQVPCIEYSDPLVIKCDPFVSVVMLAYNHEAYVEQAIEQIINQEVEYPFEIIIGEDCSTDHTLEILFKYQEKYPKLIRILTSEHNVGARMNNYRCHCACRGKYIAYCEGDDYWHDKKKLQMQVAFLERNPAYGLIFTNADSLDVTTGERVESAIPVRPELCRENDPYLRQLTGAMEIWPLTVCVRTDLSTRIVKECPEVTDTTYAMGDTQRYLEIAKRSKIKYVPVSTATRNILPESATHSKSIEKKAKFIESSQQLILHYLKKYPLPAEQDKEIRKWVAKRSLYYAYLCMDKEKAEAEAAILKSIDVRLNWKYYLYIFGSRKALTNNMVSFVFKIFRRLSIIRKNSMREFKSLRKNPVTRTSRYR